MTKMSSFHLEKLQMNSQWPKMISKVAILNLESKRGDQIQIRKLCASRDSVAEVIIKKVYHLKSLISCFTPKSSVIHCKYHVNVIHCECFVSCNYLKIHLISYYEVVSKLANWASGCLELLKFIEDKLITILQPSLRVFSAREL